MKSRVQRWRDSLTPERRLILLQKQRARMRRIRGNAPVTEQAIPFRPTRRIIDLAERQPEWWPAVKDTLENRLRNGKLPRQRWKLYLDSPSKEIREFFLDKYRTVFRSFTWRKLIELFENTPALHHPLLIELRDRMLREYALMPHLELPTDVDFLINGLTKGTKENV